MGIFTAALVMLAAASCEKNEVLPDNNSEGKVVTLKASINNGETKVSLGKKSGETYPVLWSEGDEIAVAQFVGSDVRVYKFTLTAGEGTPNGTFTCYNAVGFDPSLETKTNAVYPYTAQFNFLVVQTNQNYAEKSFDSDAILMMASMEEGSLKFNNILGILKLTIEGASDETVSSIELTANKPISGNAQFNDKAFIVTKGEYADYKNNIVLNCPNVAIDAKKEFLITVPAGTYDFAVTINTNKGTYYKSTTNKSIKESVILNMPSLDLTDFENSMPYVENGVYLGEGVELPAGEGKTIIWAPVNCGYDENHKYGLLYQWGRENGQDFGISCDNIINLEDGASPEPDKIYTNWNPTNSEWWDNKPCPMGWRVPTDEEMESLFNFDELTANGNYRYTGKENWTTIGGNSNVIPGLYCYGSSTETSGNRIFLPAAGYIDPEESSSKNRGELGCYWTLDATLLQFYNDVDDNNLSISRWTETNQAYGYSVRCVKEVPQSEPMPSGN